MLPIFLGTFFGMVRLRQHEGVMVLHNPPSAPGPPSPPAPRVLDLPSTYLSGCLGTVPDQGTCGSCWAHVTASAVESAMCLSGHGTVHLSAEQFLTCDTDNFGCSGGYIEYAMQYMSDHGLCAEGAWSNGDACDACTIVPGSVIASYETMADVSEESLKQMIMRGPTVTHFDVTVSFQTHSGSGIYTAPPQCNSTDHALLLVGWGETYWIVQNSWGTDWGNGGYAYIEKGACNIETNVYRPIMMDTDNGTSRAPAPVREVTGWPDGAYAVTGVLSFCVVALLMLAL